jgi:hypothetical protein
MILTRVWSLVNLHIQHGYGDASTLGLEYTVGEYDILILSARRVTVLKRGSVKMHTAFHLAHQRFFADT